MITPACPLVKREDDKFDASPAVVDNDLLLRGHQYLYCVATGR